MHTIKLPLNQQQRQLLDQTIAQGRATDLQSLVKRALREYRAPKKAPAKAAEGNAR